MPIALAVFFKLLLVQIAGLLLVCSVDKTVKIWRTDTGKELFTCKRHTDRIAAIIIDYTGAIVATDSRYKNVKLWELNTGKLFFTIHHSEAVEAVVFASNGIMITGGDDGIIRLFFNHQSDNLADMFC